MQALDFLAGEASGEGGAASEGGGGFLSDDEEDEDDDDDENVKMMKMMILSETTGQVFGSWVWAVLEVLGPSPLLNQVLSR